MPYYLKCRYAGGTYDNEYLVSFAAKEKKNWCFARKKDVITEPDNNGLVRVVVLSNGKYTSLVGIIESYSNTLLVFSVKTEDMDNSAYLSSKSQNYLYNDKTIKEL